MQRSGQGEGNGSFGHFVPPSVITLTIHIAIK